MDILPERFEKAAAPKAELPAAGDLLMAVWRDYLAHGRDYVRIAALTLLALPFMLPRAMLSITGVTADGSVTTSPIGNVPLAIALSLLASLAVICANVVVHAALNTSIAAGTEGKPVPMREALMTARRVFWPFVGTMALLYVIVGLGFTLLFFPGLILAVYLLCAEQAAVLEGLRPIAALKRSVELVRGRFWAVLWRAAAGYVLVALVSFMVSFPLVRMPTALFGNLFADNLAALRIALVLPIVAGAVITAAALPLFISLPLHIYKALKKLPRQE